MKILLADDERMVRIAMISMLEELYPQQHTFIEAKNGIELLDVSHLHKPDIAFVDIKMPLLDGLSGIEQALTISPDTKWFLLTGYADFEYAQKALRLGALDYLLKPASPEELKAAMEKAAQLSLHAARTRARDFSWEVVQAYTLLQSGQPLRRNLSGDFSGYVFFTDYWNQEEVKRITQIYETQLPSFMKSRSSTGQEYVLFYLSNGSLCLITKSGKHIPLVNRLQDIAQRFHTYTTVLYAPAARLSELMVKLQRITELSPLRVCYHLNANISLEELEKFDKIYPSCLSFCLLILHYSDAFFSQDEIACKRVLHALESDPAFAQAFQSISAPCTASFLEQSMHIRPEQNSFRQIIQSLAGSLNGMYQLQSTKSEVQLESLIKQYIEDNYSRDIGINTIADAFHLTPSYVSRLFHQRTGQKFIDYLTEVRIANAKRLLAQTPSITIRETAEAVGYISVRHFTKVFLRLTGMLPSEYQRSLQKRSQQK